MRDVAQRLIKSPARLARMAAASLFFLLLLFAIVDYGAVGSSTRAVLAAGIYMLLAATALLAGIPAHARIAVNAAMCILLAASLVVFLQTTPLLHILPEHPAWSAIIAYAGPVEGVASLTPADDRFALLSLALPFGFFATGLVLFDTDERAMVAWKGMAIAGGVVAIWSLLQFLLFPDTLVFGEKRFYKASLTGFFVNRNTAATFFGLIVVALFALWWRGLATLDPMHLRALVAGRRLPSDVRRRMRMFALFNVLLLAAVSALMLTQSRGGVVATFFGVMFYALSAAFMSSRATQRSGFGKVAFNWQKFIAVLAVVAGISFFFLVFAARVILRAEVQGSEDGRFCVMPGIKMAIRDNFPWGSGLASFAEAYAPYHKAACSLHESFLRAHNVYAEGMLTLGIAFPLLAAAVIMGLVLIFSRGIARRRQNRFAGFAGLAGLLVVAIHSALDFSLQIPGFAVSFACFLAPLATLCLRSPGGHPRNGPPSGRRRRRTMPPDEATAIPAKV